MTKKILIVVLILFAVGVAFTILTRYFAVPKQNDSVVVGGDRDAHGCIGSAGYSWCEVKQKCLRPFEEFCADKMTEMLGGAEETSNIKFTLRGEENFNWLVKDENVWATETLSGLVYQAQGVKMTDYNKIEKFIDDNYKVDNNNAADGVGAGQRGFIMDYSVCLLSFRAGQIKQIINAPSEPIMDDLNVTITCGYFNPNNATGISIGQQVQQILAAKYKKFAADVAISVVRFTDSYAAGGVTFSQTNGEGGLFLAMKKDGAWQVVYDGNGSIDCQKMRQEYGFPDQILKPNFCD
ncbi:MAG: hypothetical protein PHV78_03450 [Patescibacteria group bacterium]|nr:hypothetical protein [Patescibacteria group bacterium]MDD5121557.1 hypothetical protein [Patescibacteria group bacterium]MDD5222055.1 hypothetical protein [Patescibacteria group bacterium]MDD5396279.1 hypothetical protein [Patescibacteria group bacterium]